MIKASCILYETVGCKRLVALAVMTALVMLFLVTDGKTGLAHAATADEFLVVDCLLPGKMRKLGKQVSYVTARRALRTSQSDCEIRGGEYTSYDRSDYSTALQIWLPLASEGDARAQNYVGEIYEKGIGGAPQYKQAAEWYLKAAEQGLSAAQVNLGALYERGLGVGADAEKASFWYRKASGLDAANLQFVPGVKDEELRKLRNEKSAAESDRAKLQGEMERLRKQLDETQRQLKKQSQKSTGLSDELKKAREQQASAAGQANNDGRADALAAELETQRASEARLKGQLAALEKQSATLAAELTATASSRDQQLSVYRAEIEKLRTSLKAQQAGAEEKAQRVAELSDTLAARETALNAELAKSKQESAAMQASSAETTKKLAAEKAELETALANARKASAESASKSGEMARQLAELEKKLADGAQQPAGAGMQQAAQAGPEITIIDPPLSLTRGAQFNSATVNTSGAQVVVGKISSPSNVILVKVNEKEVPLDKNFMFRADVPVQAPETMVNVVAVDTRGVRRALSFNLVKGSGQTPAGQAGGDGPLDPAALRVKFGEYHALVIGNGKYQFLPELKTAKNDAEQVSKMLRETYGFKVTTLLDASRYDILSTLNKMRESLTDEQNLLIYYAGHGDLDRVNQRGNWLPVDAEPDSTANWISNIQITDVLNAMSARQILLVVDSCYSGTLTRAGLARLDSGMSPALRGKWIEKMAEKRSRVVLTSGGVAPVLDGGGGAHSVFAKAFLNALGENTGVLEGQQLFQMVSAEVAASSATAEFEQVPQYAPIKYAGHEAGDFFLVPSRLR